MEKEEMVSGATGGAFVRSSLSALAKQQWRHTVDRKPAF